MANTILPLELIIEILLAIEPRTRRPISYALVCRSWHGLVFASGALWSTIHIITDAAVGTDTTAFFERSRDLPLDVLVSCRKASGTAPWATSSKRALKLLRRNFHRVRSLEIRSHAANFIRTVLDPYIAGSVSAPMLEEFVIVAPRVNDSERGVSSGAQRSSPIFDGRVRFLTSPRFTRLTLAVPLLSPGPPSSDALSPNILGNITHLTVDRGSHAVLMSLGNITEILRSVRPTLESLTYRGCDNPYDRTIDTWHMRDHDIEMEFPKLRRLSVSVHSCGLPVILLLTMPRLEEAQLTAEELGLVEEVWEHEDMDKIVTPSQVLLALRARWPLRRVELWNVRGIGAESCSALFGDGRNDDTLQELVIHGGDLTESNLRASASMLAPTLRLLELRDVHGVTNAILRDWFEHASTTGRSRSVPLRLLAVGCGQPTREDGEPEGLDLILTA